MNAEEKAVVVREYLSDGSICYAVRVPEMIRVATEKDAEALVAAINAANIDI